MNPFAFVVSYAIAVLVLIPASAMTIVAGAWYGVARGTAYALIGALIGSTGAFLVARYGARDFVARRLAALSIGGRLGAVERAVTARGLPIVFLLRLSPIVPFNFLNYALGLTTIKLRDFLVASAGMIPGAIMYAYAGKVAGVALAVAGEAQVPRETSYYALLIGGLAATMASPGHRSLTAVVHGRPWKPGSGEQRLDDVVAQPAPGSAMQASAPLNSAVNPIGRAASAINCCTARPVRADPVMTTWSGPPGAIKTSRTASGSSGNNVSTSIGSPATSSASRNLVSNCVAPGAGL